MNFSGRSGPSEAEAAEPVASAKEVCLEDKPITRLVDPPLFGSDKELIVSGRLNKRSIEVTSMIVVCMLALFCCLFAKAQNDKLEAEIQRLNHSYSTEARWESVDRMRLERELSAARQQVEALAGKPIQDLDSMPVPVTRHLHHRVPFGPGPVQVQGPGIPVPPPIPADSLSNVNSQSSSTSSSSSKPTSAFDDLRHQYLDKY